MILDTAVVDENGALYYYENGKRTANAGLVLVNGDYYYIDSAAKAVTNTTVKVDKTNNLLAKGTYIFGEDGKLVFINGVFEGYYYVDGLRAAAGLVLFEGNYYYAENGGKLVAGKSVWVGNTNGLLTAGTYRFAADGKMILTTDVVDEDGTLYYYQNGRRTANAGLVLVNGDYYFIDGAAKAVTNTTVKVDKTNNLLAKGTYVFGADGKLVFINGVFEDYYYVDGLRTAAGLVLFEGDYYYAEDGGKLAASKSAWVGYTNGLLTAGTYRFDAEGKMILTTDVVNENGTLYYYQNGRRVNNAGLVKIGEDYYCILSGAIAAANSTTWVGNVNGHPFTSGNYRFDADGKMILTTDVVDENGTLY